MEHGHLKISLPYFEKDLWNKWL